MARPNLFAWAPNDKPLRIIEQSVAKDDPDPKALAAYGILLRLVQSDSSIPDSSIKEEVWLRFVDGQPISSVTTQFLDWVCKRLEALGKTALLMPWDNAPWHVSREVRTWVRDHNQRVKREKRGVRIIACYLPIKSPWLNPWMEARFHPIEPCWVHAKRKVVEPGRLLTAKELAERVCAHFHCQHDKHLAIPEKVA